MFSRIGQWTISLSYKLAPARGVANRARRGERRAVCALLFVLGLFGALLLYPQPSAADPTISYHTAWNSISLQADGDGDQPSYTDSESYDLSWDLGDDTPPGDEHAWASVSASNSGASGTLSTTDLNGGSGPSAQAGNYTSLVIYIEDDGDQLLDGHTLRVHWSYSYTNTSPNDAGSAGGYFSPFASVGGLNVTQSDSGSYTVDLSGYSTSVEIDVGGYLQGWAGDDDGNSTNDSTLSWSIWFSFDD
jgi:hypothetical protein